MIDWHRPRMSALVSAGVDLVAIDTIPAQSEALALCQLLQEFPRTKAWLSFSCKVWWQWDYYTYFPKRKKKEKRKRRERKEREYCLCQNICFKMQDGTQTCHGEPFLSACSDVISLSANQIVAVGINCTSPNHMTSLLTQLQPIRDKIKFVVYPNSGETWTNDKRWVKSIYFQLVLNQNKFLFRDGSHPTQSCHVPYSPLTGHSKIQFWIHHKTILHNFLFGTWRFKKAMLY